MFDKKNTLLSFEISLKNQIYYRRATTVKGQSNRNGVYLCWRCTLNGNRIEASDGASHYQELNAIKEESTF